VPFLLLSYGASVVLAIFVVLMVMHWLGYV
jgi:cell division protein FtsW (lipid II flippase)